MAPEDLLALAAGIPGLSPSVNARAAQRFWGQATRLWRTRVGREPQGNVLEITNLLAGLSQQGMPPGDLALEAPLRMAQLTGWSLPAVAMSLPPEEAGDRWQPMMLANLAEELATSHERLIGLERDFHRWLSLLPESRTDSRLTDAVVLLGTVHALTPRYLVESLGLTRQAAARILRKMEGLGIITQATKRQRWIIYMAQNAVKNTNVPETTRDGIELGNVDVENIDKVLDQAFAALDRTMKREDA